MNRLVEEIHAFTMCAELSDGTKKRYQNHLLDFAEFLSKETGQPLEEVFLTKIHYISYDEADGFYLPITSELIDKYLEKNLYKSYSWLKRATSALISLFMYLSTQYDFRNVMRDIEFRLSDHYVEPSHKRAFNRQEILKFLRSIIKYSVDPIQDTLLFITLFTTGCRINEILSLTRKDLHFNENTFFLKNTKNKMQMYVAAKIGLMKAFEIYCAKYNICDNDLIFRENGKPLLDSQVRARLKYFSELENLPVTRVHDTRRAFVTIMYENGSDLTVIQQMINHLWLKSTQGYLGENAVRNNGIKIPIFDQFFAECRSIVYKKIKNEKYKEQ